MAVLPLEVAFAVASLLVVTQLEEVFRRLVAEHNIQTLQGLVLRLIRVVLVCHLHPNLAGLHVDLILEGPVSLTVTLEFMEISQFTAVPWVPII